MPNVPKVEITEDLISRACRANSSHCMIAEAIQEQMPDAKHVSVDLGTIRYTRMGTGRRYIILTPLKAQLAIIEFDQGRAVEPFTVALKPAQIVKSNRKKKITADGEKKKPRQSTPSVPERTKEEQDAAPARAILGGQEPVSEGSEPTWARRLAVPEGPGSVPTVIGGNPPPVMKKAGHGTGRRREFGMRALEK